MPFVEILYTQAYPSSRDSAAALLRAFYCLQPVQQRTNPPAGPACTSGQVQPCKKSVYLHMFSAGGQGNNVLPHSIILLEGDRESQWTAGDVSTLVTGLCRPSTSDTLFSRTSNKQNHHGQGLFESDTGVVPSRWGGQGPFQQHALPGGGGLGAIS
jgi:hypothetical protein